MHESEKWKGSRSVVSDSSQPHGLQPTRLLHPWDFPGKSTGVGCHCLFLLGATKYWANGFCAQDSFLPSIKWQHKQVHPASIFWCWDSVFPEFCDSQWFCNASLSVHGPRRPVSSYIDGHPQFLRCVSTALKLCCSGIVWAMQTQLFTFLQCLDLIKGKMPHDLMIQERQREILSIWI